MGWWDGDCKVAVDLGMCGSFKGVGPTGSSISGRVRMWLFGGTQSNALFYSVCGKFEGWKLEEIGGEWLEMNVWRS